ncbi:MAG: UMP kinase [Candidatus Pacearchaeota archaeon]
MKKKVVVISLGGSLIVPNEIRLEYLRKFREVIKKNTNKYKFVIVCGGGSVARKYIKALAEEGKNYYIQSLAGISVTRLNARFMAYFFGFDPTWGIPHDMKHVKNLLKKHDIVFCGALRYAPNQTSDATSLKLARFFKTFFINLTNVKGLFDKNPFEHKDAKFIPKISIDDFHKMIMKIEYKPGMHAPVDTAAAKIMKKYKIKSYILGDDVNQLDNLLNGKEFVGTIIE